MSPLPPMTTIFMGVLRTGEGDHPPRMVPVPFFPKLKKGTDPAGA